jgi:hypothetical protein
LLGHPSTYFFISSVGTKLSTGRVTVTFFQISRAIGLHGKDMANIADDDLRRLRDLSEQSNENPEKTSRKKLKIKELVEICNAKETV